MNQAHFNLFDEPLDVCDEIILVIAVGLEDMLYQPDNKESGSKSVFWVHKGRLHNVGHKSRYSPTPNSYGGIRIFCLFTVSRCWIPCHLHMLTSARHSKYDLVVGDPSALIFGMLSCALAKGTRRRH